MNFLSHYYLDRNSNTHFNIGLTLPDILSLHSRRFRVTEDLIFSKKRLSKTHNVSSLLDGMFIHLKLDNLFHNSKFFGDNHLFLTNKYSLYKKHFELPYFIFHILLEILIDRYLLIEKEPNLANEFYMEYKDFDFDDIGDLFVENRYYNKDLFLKFTKNFANSTFLNDYIYYDKIVDALNRISIKIGREINLDTNNDYLIKYIKESYEELASKISLYIDSLSRHKF